MVAPTKLNAKRPAVSAATPAAPSAAPKPTELQLTQARPSEFDGTRKKKPANITGGFRPVPGVKVGSPALAGDVKAFRAAAAAGTTATKADPKVSQALSRLTALQPATAKDLIAENAKLSPTQQHALLMQLPDTLRQRLEGELKKLPPDQRGEQLSWMGDKLPGLSKDGYVSVTVAPTLHVQEGRGTTRIKYPSKVDLGNGKSVTASAEGGDLMVKYGSQQLRAVKVPGGWAFYEQVKSGRQGDAIDHAGRMWRPVTSPSRDQATMMTAFREGATMAENFSGRLDPASEQVFRDRAIDAAIPGARKNLETLSKDAATWTGFARSSAEWLAANQKWLAPAVQAGHIAMSQQPDGSVSLTLQRPSGMRDSEWKKIQAEFGPKVAQFEARLSKDQQWLVTQLSIRDRAASGALATFRSPSFQRYLSTLPPRQRLDEVTRLAQSLKGTGAGAALAEDLFGPNAFKVGADGKLQPQSELAKTVFADAWNPDARVALQQLTLSLGPQLSGSGANTLARSMEVLRGAPLTARQRAAVEALHAVKTPKDFQKLTNPDPKSPPSVLDKAGDVSDLLSEIGEMPEGEKLGNVQNPLVNRATDAVKANEKAIKYGSALVATFQVYNSTKDLLEKGVTADTAMSFAEDATRAIGTWGSVLELAGKADFLVKMGKVAGPVSDAIGLINDMRRDSSSAEGGYRNNVHVGASALILAGGLAGGPVGVAGVLVGLGVKLFYDRTSEAYEEMHANLKRLPNL